MDREDSAPTADRFVLQRQLLLGVGKANLLGTLASHRALPGMRSAVIITNNRLEGIVDD